MQFKRQDMEATHYTWSETTDDTVFSGQPSRRLFDRFNGNQVLFIINFYGSQSERFTPEDGRAIEYDISNHLPFEAKSEISVFNWIQATHNK
jgi:hypothetical protein